MMPGSSGVHELHDEASLQRRMQQLLQKQHQVGPNLSRVRQNQQRDGVREFYSLGHLKELLRYEAKAKLASSSKWPLCSNVHGDNCTSCTTCHFCRQKTIDQKTSCARCGSSEGMWCAGCLSGRVGENIHEVLPLCAAGKWVCPVCRDICNCSNAHCLRHVKCWGSTGQLVHEAKNFGYGSVAAYLILTAIDKNAPSPNLQPQHLRGSSRPAAAAAPQQQQQQRAVSQGTRAAEAAAKKQHMLRALELLGQQQAELLQSAAQECALGCDILGVEAPRSGQRHGFAPSLQLLRDRQQQQQQQRDSSSWLSPPGVGTAQQRAQQPLAARPPAGAAAPRAARPAQAQRGSNAGGGAAAGTGEGAAAEQGVDAASDGLSELLQLLDLPINPATSTASLGNSPASRQQAGAGPGHEGSSSAGGAPAQGGSAGSAPAAAGAAFGAGAGTASASAGTPQPQQQHQQSRPASTSSGAQRRNQQAQGVFSPPSSAAGAGYDQPDDFPGVDAPGYASGVGGNRSWRYGASASSLQQRMQHRGAAASLQTGAWHQRSWSDGPAHRRPRARRAPSRAAAAGDTAAARQAAGPAAAAYAPAAPAAGGSAAAAAAAGASADAAATAAGLHTNADGSAGAAASDMRLQPDADPGLSELEALCDELDAIIRPDSGSPAAAAVEEAAAAAAAVEEAASGSAAAAAAGAGDAPSSERARPSDAQATTDAAAAAEAAAKQLAKLAASSACPGPLRGLQADIEFALTWGDGLPYEELRDQLDHILQLAFHSNTDFDRSRVMSGFSEAPARDGAACSLQTVQAACDNLTFLIKHVHHELYPDLVLRLSNKECFVDFGGSDPEARTALITTAQQMLAVLQTRSLPYEAIMDAWEAAGSPAPPVASADLVNQLAHAALDGMQAASDAVDELLDCVLGWMTLLHEEGIRVAELMQKGPLALCPEQDSFGPLRWRPLSSYRQRDWATMSSAQVQAEEQDLAAQRRVWLDVLLLFDEQLLLALVLMLQGAADKLSRKQAARLLTAPVMAQLLDLSVPHQQRQHFVLLCTKLLQQAAPDLQQHRQWQVQDVQCMRQKLQQQQQLQAPLPGGQLADHCADLVCQVWDGLLEPAERQQELAAVCSSVLPLLLPATELMVNAEYQYRAPEDTHILSSLRRQSTQLGTVKVRLLAALHALQLQAGGSSWPDVERSMVRPVDSLTTFFRSPRLQEHRRFMLFLAGQTVSSTPSLLSWAVQQQQQAQAQAGSRQHQQQPPGAWQPQRPPGGNRTSTDGGLFPVWHQKSAQGAQGTQAAAAAAAPRPAAAVGQLPQAFATPTGQPHSIPAAALLRLWLLTLLDSYSPDMFVPCVQAISRQLAVCPATAPLMQAVGSSVWLQDPEWLQQLLQQDAIRAGDVRAGLFKAVLQALVQQQGVNKLAEVLAGLHLDLAAWRQHQLDDSQRSLASVLLWERDVAPSLLVLCGLALKHPQLNARLPLPELVQLVSAGMQDSIKGLCGQRSSSAPSEHSPGSSSGSGGQRVNLQDTALVHLPRFLALVVHLAGLSGSCEGAATTMWPATAISSSSSGSQQTLQALLTASYSAAARIELGRIAPLKQLYCLRDLLGTAFMYMPTTDSSAEQQSGLLELLAHALAQQSGLTQASAASVECCPTAAGFVSPGMLHHVLNVHVHAACNAAAEQGTDRSNHAAVNALKLARAVLQKLLPPQGVQLPAELQQCSQQLLLPALANPLLKVLTAGPGRCPRVQQQAVGVLQDVLAGPLGQQLLPVGNQAEAPSGSRPFGPGPLRNMEPLPQRDLQCVCLELLELSMLTCTATAEAQAGDGLPVADGPAQQELRQRRQGAGNVLTRVLGCVGSLPQQAISYPEPRPLSGQHELTPIVPHTPQDAGWRLLRAGLCFAGMLAKQRGVGQQAVCKLLMPQLHELVSNKPMQMRPIRQELEAVRKALPAEQQEAWRLPPVALMPPPPKPLGAAQGGPAMQHQQRQQQQWQPVPPGRPQGQQQQQQRQQQQAGAGVPQPQHMHGRAVAPTASAAASGAQQPAAHPAASVSQCPASSYMPFSQAGGMVASCAGPEGPSPAGTAAQARQLSRADNGAAAAAGHVQECAEEAGSDGDDCGTSAVAGSQAVHDLQQSQAGTAQRKKQRLSCPAAAGVGAGAASGLGQAQQQQQQQLMEGHELQPDTASQDQEVPRKRLCVEQQGHLAAAVAAVQQPAQQQAQPQQSMQQQQPHLANQPQHQHAPAPKRQRLEQQAAAGPSSSSSQQQQRSSKGRSSSDGRTSGLVLVGRLCSCDPLTTATEGGAKGAEEPYAGLQYCLRITRNERGSRWQLTASGQLADRVKLLLTHGLLQKEDVVVVVNVQLLDKARNIVQQTRGSTLLVDPAAEVQKGLVPPQSAGTFWQTAMQKWKSAKPAQQQQQSSRSHSSGAPADQQQQQQAVQPQASVAERLAQDQGFQQQVQPVLQRLQQKQQQQHQRILQQQQQQQAQPPQQAGPPAAGAGAAQHRPGPAHAGAALEPQHPTVQDSQATIPYPTHSSLM